MTFLIKDIRDHLAGSTNIVNAFGDNIYAGVMPQTDSNGQPLKPQFYAIINDLSNEPELYLGGEAGTHISTIQIDVWTDGTGRSAKANELGELIRNRLNRYRGTFGTGCYGTAEMIRNNTVTVPPVDGSANHRWRVSMDFKIIHTAAVPTFT